MGDGLESRLEQAEQSAANWMAKAGRLDRDLIKWIDRYNDQFELATKYREAIENGPHLISCASFSHHFVAGLNAVANKPPIIQAVLLACDCWKSKALNDGSRG